MKKENKAAFLCNFASTLFAGYTNYHYANYAEIIILRKIRTWMTGPAPNLSRLTSAFDPPAAPSDFRECLAGVNPL